MTQATKTTSTPFYESEYSFYEPGEYLAIYRTKSGNGALINRQLHSTRFAMASDALAKYSACISQVSTFCKELDEKLQNRKASSQQMSTATDNDKLGSAFEQIEDGLKNLISSENAAAMLDFASLKRFHSEGKAKANEFVVDDVCRTMIKCNPQVREDKEFRDSCSNEVLAEFDKILGNEKTISKIRDSDINGPDNISNLEIFLKERIAQRNEISSQLEKLADKKSVFIAPGALQQRWHEVKDSIMEVIGKVKNSAASFLGVELCKQFNLITEKILPAITNLQLPPALSDVEKNGQLKSYSVIRLSDVKENGQLESYPVIKNCWDVPSFLEEFGYKVPRDEISGKILDKVYKKVRELDLKGYTFEGAKRQLRYDYEFRRNLWVYAYMRCMIEQNNVENAKRVYEIYQQVYNDAKKELDGKASARLEAYSEETDLSSPSISDSYSHSTPDPAFQDDSQAGTIESDDSGVPLRQNDTPNLTTGLPDDGSEAKTVADNTETGSTDTSNIDDNTNGESFEDVIRRLNGKYGSISTTPNTMSNDLRELAIDGICSLNSDEQNFFLTLLINLWHTHPSGSPINVLLNFFKKKSILRESKNILESVLSAFAAAIDSDTFLFEVKEEKKEEKKEKKIIVFSRRGKKEQLFEIVKKSSKIVEVKIFSQGEEKRSFEMSPEAKIDDLISSIIRGNRDSDKNKDSNDTETN